jgi:hypothetical protein
MSHLIKGITSDHDLIELAKHIGVHLNGIYELPEITKPLPKKGSYIILLRQEGGGVGHWVSVHDNTYFDSMNIGPPAILGKLPHNNIQYQSTYGEFCGVWSLFWLYCKQKKRMDLLEGFTNLDSWDQLDV